MENRILGLHHITAIAGLAKRNVDFYTHTLGLRLLKKTVNFDDPGTYHLYYGDEKGSAGTILTFFPYEGASRGRAGTGMATNIAYAVPEGSFAAGTDLQTTADLNLRDGPATTFAVIMTMPSGSLVKVQTTSGADGWVHVDFQGTVGYASKTYLVVP